MNTTPKNEDDAQQFCPDRNFPPVNQKYSSRQAAGLSWHKTAAVRLLALFAAAITIVGLASCGDRALELPKSSNNSKQATTLVNIISEVSPPATIQQLRQALEIYQPQVSILNPKLDEVIQDTDVSLLLQVKDLPIFKDANLGLGPHLQVILDDRPYKTVYDTSQPLVLSDLTPGTHTLRVFASKPWEESFKNDGAWAQTTFHIFTKTEDNKPDRSLPLLTYNQPQNTYGAEPIMLDFYLTNAPLHSVAREDAEDEILDWKIRATVNGESFTLDQWQPIYLKGFKPGKNWVQLELLDEKGNPIENVFNNTVKLVNYQPQGQDSLAKLVRGELTVTDARGTIDRNYKPPTPKPTPIIEPTPKLEQLPITKPSPTVEQKPVANPTVFPEEQQVKTIEPAPKPNHEIEQPKEVESAGAIEPAPVATPQIEEQKKVEPVRAIEQQPTAPPEIGVPKVIESVGSEEKPTATGQIETQKNAEPVKAIEPQPIATPEVETPKRIEPVVSEPQPKATERSATPKIGDIMNSLRNYFDRVAQPRTPSNNLPPTLPEITEKAPVSQLTQPTEPKAYPNLVTRPSPLPETTMSEPKEPTKSAEQKVEFEI